MKRLALAVCALGSTLGVQAQALNEVELNIFNTIVNQSVEIGYEHFIDQDQSIGADLLINDRFSYYGQNKKEGKFKQFNTNAIAVNYSFYFGGKEGEHASGFYAQPFLKYRFGDYEHDVEIAQGVYQRQTVDMNSLIIGVGGGYKLVKNDAFTVAPFVNIGRNFKQEVADEFMGVELNAGINIGYRF
ncbi:autotransporter outer membrane beta-barrel domain-containing protein [Flavobacterium sp. CBA20B-1]|uniref:Autotransporter outer membrane beta-barrel domain-containing protein n=1 Tax=Paenimyroides aestuarii TaxID=2968490 RepID=A0ABY5NVJ1_9FLAO|nr:MULTISPECIES: autotransporter outer membrane beta-barrel domain-containing protein [Flavobacteriaceae]UUV22483.1 autotransporter outer membrane beta-barrel domain-containing protein [Paenimyroides aestuarii]WCM41338.1 autotransporter outer membrane beta-barrel domain-containing protein [Flavobacterium sp. CBA20B-1]